GHVHAGAAHAVVIAGWGPWRQPPAFVSRRRLPIDNRGVICWYVDRSRTYSTGEQGDRKGDTVKITNRWAKKGACWRVKGNGFNRGFDHIVAVDAFIDGILLMTPKTIDVIVTDRTPEKSFEWRIEQLRRAEK